MHALLFTDVENSTRLHESLGDARAAEVWAAHDRHARDLLARHGGREIGRADGMFLLFDRAPDAARYALDYHAALADLGLAARLGIHVGPVALRENAASDVARGAASLEVDGIATPITARLMALARGGQTLVSAAARDAIGSDLPPSAVIASHGHYRLKGIEAPLEVYELGVHGTSRFEPPADVDKAYRVVRAGELWQPVREVRHNLPAERDAFVDRHAELRALAARLAEGVRLVTVQGPAGTGKTRFARRYGWTWLGEWPGGLYFCDLSDARSIEGIVSAVAAALAVPLGRQDPVVQLGHAIAGRGRCLVILDNFEQVVEQAPATLGRWLDVASVAAFVVTSRERLQLPGEALFPIEPLPVDAEGIELFVERARALQPTFAPNPSDRAAVADIVGLLDGLPLAIELAAARIRVFAPSELALRMRDRFRWLGQMRGTAHRQSTLLAAIDWSWELLKPWEQAALAHCSTFEGGFTLAAAEVVVEIAPTAEAVSVADVVQALCDKSLLRTFVSSPSRSGAGESRLFAMYLSIRDYAAAKLAAYGSSVQRAAEARHGAYFARFGAEEAIEALGAPGGVERRRALAQQLDNLSLACRRAIDRGDAACSVDTYAAAWAVLDLSGPNESGVALGAQVLAMSGLTSNQRIRAALRYAVALRRVNRGEEAAHRLLDALALLPSASDPRLEASLLSTLAGVRADQNRMDEASSLAQAALRLAREAGNDGLAGNIHNNLGIYDAERGSYEDARVHFEAALALHRRIGDRRSEGMDTVNLATVLGLHQRAREAILYFERALAIHVDVGDRRNEGLALANLGMIYRDEMRLPEAEERCVRALALHREVGNRFAEGAALAALGEIYLLQGRLGDSETALRAGETLLREVDERRELVALLCVRGRLALARRTREDAHAALAEAEAIVGEMGDALADEPRRKVESLRALLS